MLPPFNMTLSTFKHGKQNGGWLSIPQKQEERHHLPLYSSWHWNLPFTMQNISGSLSLQAQLETPCQQRKIAKSTRCFLCRHYARLSTKNKGTSIHVLLCTSHLGIRLVFLDPQTQEQAWKIEMVQRRAARFVMSDYTSVTTQDRSSRRFKHWDGKSWMNGEHWQRSSYCIVSCTVLLHSHQHSYAYTQPHPYASNFIFNLCSRRNVFQHSFP